MAIELLGVQSFKAHLFVSSVLGYLEQVIGWSSGKAQLGYLDLVVSSG